MKSLPALLLALPLVGCISLSSSETSSAPDYAGFCQDKELQCKQNCGDLGVQSFACKAAPREGLEYRCECKKPAGRTL